MVFSATLTTENLLDHFPDKTNGYLIAFSGGADSTALLHLFKNHKNLRAIHINHGIQIEADNWQNHCQYICDQFDIPLIIEKAHLQDHSENSCRLARYDFFKKHLKHGETLLTAHHAGDQAETILLKLLRGTGIKGLCGIEKNRPFYHGHLARPLLDFKPEQLKAYLIKHQINWIEDPSNQESAYKRNAIRNEILPVLQRYFPDTVDHIVRSAENCQQSLDLMSQLGNFNGKHLSLSLCRNLPHHLQPTVIYHWLTDKGLPIPDKKTLKQITHDFLSAPSNRHPHYKNKYYQIYRWQNRLHCIKNFTHVDDTTSYDWHTAGHFELPNHCGKLIYNGNTPIDLIVRFRQTGHKLKTHKHQFNKTVKQLFQDHNIPPWLKANTPFIFYQDELVSLGHDWSHTKAFKSHVKFQICDFYNTNPSINQS